MLAADSAITPAFPGLEDFLRGVLAAVQAANPALVPLYEVFAQEVRVARRWLSPSLERIPKQGRILEVGAGLLLLSCLLQKEGFRVAALEPIGPGFSMFSELQAVVLEYAKGNGFAPEIMAIGVEDLQETEKFAFAFSINVMEHVPSVSVALERVANALVPGGEYRFTCPNYWFPYEPHFNIPTLVTKGVTEMVLGRVIFSSKRVTDPHGTWDSLNWISIFQVKRIVRRLTGMTVVFNREALGQVLERVETDPSFAQRRSGWMRKVVGILVFFRVHRAAMILFPLLFYPIIDCCVRKTEGVENPQWDKSLTA